MLTGQVIATAATFAGDKLLFLLYDLATCYTASFEEGLYRGYQSSYCPEYNKRQYDY